MGTNGWENETTGYVETVKALLTDPATFFRSIDTDAPIGRALMFAAISFFIAGVGQAIWSFAGGSLQLLPHLTGGGEGEGELAAAGIGVVAQVIFSLMMPLWAIAGAFLGGAITHLFLVLLGDGEKGYMTTVKASLYGSATGVIYLVPCCGSLVASIWTLVITIIGLMEMHRTSAGKVLGAVFGPILICCLCLLVVIGVVFALGGAAAFSQFARP